MRRMRTALMLVSFSLLACGGGDPVASSVPPRPVPLSGGAGTVKAVNALGSTIFLPTLASLEEGSCFDRSATLRRRLMAMELLYEGVPAGERAPRGPSEFPETLPAAQKPPGEEFAGFVYGPRVGLTKDGDVVLESGERLGVDSEGRFAGLGELLSGASVLGDGVLFAADQHAPGDAVRAVLRALRAVDVPRVGLLFHRPLDRSVDRAPAPAGLAGRRSATKASGPVSDVDLVFGVDCPGRWGVVDQAKADSKREAWIAAALRAYEQCDCEIPAAEVAWLQEQELSLEPRVAIPVDVRGTQGDRPLIVASGRPWGPAAKALYEAIRIDPKRPRGTPVLLDLEASDPLGFAPTVKVEAK